VVSKSAASTASEGGAEKGRAEKGRSGEGSSSEAPGGGEQAPGEAVSGAEDYAVVLARVRAALEHHAGEAEGAAPAAAAPLSAADPEADAAQPGDGPLSRLVRIFGLDPFERDVLMMCAGMELDATFGPLCASAQVDAGRAYPTFGLALAVLPGGSWRSLLPDAPLRHWQLVRLEAGAGLTSARLTIDEGILHRILGLASREPRLAGRVEPVDRSLLGGELVPSHHELALRLGRTWQRTWAGGELPVVELCGTDTRSKWAVAAAACDLLGVGLESVAAESLPTAAGELDELIRLWQRQALLSRSALLVAADDLRPDDAHEVSVRRLVDRLRSPLIVSRDRRLPPRHRAVLSLDVERPAAEEQRQVWRAALDAAGAADDLAADDGDVAAARARIDALVDTFDLSASDIRSAGVEALGRLRGDGEAAAAPAPAEAPTPSSTPSSAPPADLSAALWETCRARVRPSLSDLAERIEARATWRDLVLPEDERRTLTQVVAHIRRRGRVYREWGFGSRSSRGNGVAVLFGGPSGTGKTMAAEVLSDELGLDLYRIDLSSVISKYIGETEKNLQRIFDAAEAGGAILLFDEADALFGKRSEVKDSHDRYANIEVSYLLQRMESYRGLAILTTNLPDALDPAFRRRLRFIVHFPFPDVEQRRELWRRVFPEELPTEGVAPEKLARLNAAGGHIRNIALHAAFLAAADDRPVTMGDLEAAAHREFAKIGRPLSEAETRGWA